MARKLHVHRPIARCPDAPLTREHGGEGFLRGRVDGNTLAAILDNYAAPVAVIDHALLCGPPEMVAHLSAALDAQGMAADKILAESFRATPAAKPEPPDILRRPHASTRHVEIRLAGRSTIIEARPGETVVDAARRCGVEVPYSCGVGTCCSCIARIVDGAVEIQYDAALEPWERQAGFVLTCQSRPAGDSLVVDYDDTF